LQTGLSRYFKLGGSLGAKELAEKQHAVCQKQENELECTKPEINVISLLNETSLAKTCQLTYH
jgi:hypothetical protein